MPSIKKLLVWVAVGANFSSSPGVWFDKSCGRWRTDLRSDRTGDCLQWNSQADGVQTFFSKSTPATWTALHVQLQNRNWKEPCSHECLKLQKKKKNPTEHWYRSFSYWLCTQKRKSLASCFIPSQPDYKLAVYINSWKPFPRTKTGGT